jgi:hypothetical protein
MRSARGGSSRGFGAERAVRWDHALAARMGGDMTEAREDRRTGTGPRVYLVERRKGKLWMYGSVVLCVALMAYFVAALIR